MIFIAFQGQSKFISKNYIIIESYGTIFAAKWSSNSQFEAVITKACAQGQKGLNANRCSFYCAFFRQMRFFDHTTKLGMKDLLKPNNDHCMISYISKFDFL